jgi:hypothetical protein
MSTLGAGAVSSVFFLLSGSLATYHVYSREARPPFAGLL